MSETLEGKKKSPVHLVLALQPVLRNGITAVPEDVFSPVLLRCAMRPHAPSATAREIIDCALINPVW